MSKKTINEKEEYLKKRAVMAAKYDAEKKETEKKELDSKASEEKIKRDRESSKEDVVNVEKKDIPVKT